MGPGMFYWTKLKIDDFDNVDQNKQGGSLYLAIVQLLQVMVDVFVAFWKILQQILSQT